MENTNSLLLDLTDLEEIVEVEFTVDREAAYTNVAFFYPVENLKDIVWNSKIL